MNIKSISLALLFAVTVAIPSRAALLISEVLFNEVGSDTTGEWIEIHNTGPGTIDLSNYKIGDEETSGATSTTEAMFQFPAGAMIGPGQFQIISAGATRFNTVYGFMPNYETASTEASVPDMTIYSTWDSDGGTLSMSNTNDQAALVDPSDAIIDGVNWGNNAFLNPGLVQPVPDGTSYERIVASVDTDTAADWKLGTPSSPGAAPIPEPAGALLLTLAGMFFASCRRRR
jgi:hypothetical protein